MSNSLWLAHTERFNKKCKNLTTNKSRPIASLSGALVRDGTARYFRWRRKASPCRTCKLPITEVIDSPKRSPIADNMNEAIQAHMSCGCHVRHAALYVHGLAKIGGKRFHAGEALRLGSRCGSVVTMVRGGRSIYGLVHNFYRVVCQCNQFIDFGVIAWFPFPCYPDADPLTVTIRLNGLDVNNIRALELVPLYDIQPSRIAVEIDTLHDSLLMLRMQGIDTIP